MTCRKDGVMEEEVDWSHKLTTKSGKGYISTTLTATKLSDDGIRGEWPEVSTGKAKGISSWLLAYSKGH